MLTLQRASSSLLRAFAATTRSVAPRQIVAGFANASVQKDSLAINIRSGRGKKNYPNVTYLQRPGDGHDRVVTLIPGEGIGPELCDAVVEVFKHVHAPVVWDVQHDYMAANGTIKPAVIESMKRNGVVLKGNFETPIGSGPISRNLYLRRTLDLFAHVIHSFSIPGIKTRHDNVDVVIIRENTEGEYSGLEHEVVPGVVESLKVITKKNSLRIAEFAFEYAFLTDRRKVTAVHKANIMKMCDGMFLQATREVAKRYPSIEYNEVIIDNCCMQLVMNPWQFDVMVMPNLYGSIVSNIGAGLTGGPGLTPGGNVGNDVAVFEQGTRHIGKDIAGQGVANPTAMLLSSVMMLRHLRLPAFADMIEQAVFKVLEENKKTRDIGGTLTTRQFLDAVIDKLS